MRKRIRGLLCAASLVLVLAGSAVLAQENHRVDDASLKNAAKNGNEWLTYGHDYGDTHYSPLKQIDTNNASKLGLAWYFQTDSDTGTEEANPVIANGTMYVTTAWDLLYALDARTGKLKWSWDPKIGHMNFPRGSAGNPDRVRTGPSLCCGPGNRGVAIYGGKVYIGTLDARLVALDAKTGKVVWDVRTAGANTDYSITGAPRVIRGNVIIGNGGGEYNTRGYVTAYNAETGSEVWRFYTVPGEPANPIEDGAMKMAAKTWTGDKSHIGGGNPWNAISYDPKLNLIYVGTGQGGPWVRKYRSPGGGDNLFICSIVALHADTGKFAWYFQETPGDVWDYDSTADIMLADLRIDGKLRHVAMQAPKNGYFYVIDRTNGKFISGAPLEHATWAKGLDPKTGRPIFNPEAFYDNKSAMVWPGAGGGHVWQGMSFNPDTGLVYVPGMNDSPFNYMAAPNYKYALGEYDFGILFTRPAAPRPGAAPKTPRPARMTPFLVAWDPVTETQRWLLSNMGGGGTVSTAGGLVFAASDVGDFEALNAQDGKELWKVKLTPGFGNPVTYMIDGQQYVTVLCGRTGKSRVYTFALDGSEPMPPSAFGGN
ncbi:MAG: PQQ-dependent dehydrogenase, methanol/ethanol family [Candidatus Acidiferrales bacterium]